MTPDDAALLATVVVILAIMIRDRWVVIAALALVAFAIGMAP